MANEEFWAKVDEFKGKADEFYAQWQRMRDLRQAAQRDPDALKEWNALMGEAEDVQAKMSDVERAIQQAKEWAGGLFGVDETRNGLGLAYPLAIALITGAIAWLGSWLAKAYQLDRKLSYQENLIGQGVDPRVAAQTAKEEEGGFFPALGQGIGQGVAIAALVGVALFIMFRRARF